jgi:hypothetical protein
MKLKERLVMAVVLILVLCVVLVVRVHLIWAEKAATPLGGAVHSSASAARSNVRPSLHPIPAMPAHNSTPKHSSSVSLPVSSKGMNIIHLEAPQGNASVKNYQVKVVPLKVSPLVASKDPWSIWEGWVRPDYLYPAGAFYSEEMNHILNVMATAPITSFGVGHKGTQLKATAMLGAQRTVFKPKR